MSVPGAEVADQQQRHEAEPRHRGRQAEVGPGGGGARPLQQGRRHAAGEVEDGLQEHDAQRDQVLKIRPDMQAMLIILGAYLQAFLSHRL